MADDIEAQLATALRRESALAGVLNAVARGGDLDSVLTEIASWTAELTRSLIGVVFVGDGEVVATYGSGPDRVPTRVDRPFGDDSAMTPMKSEGPPVGVAAFRLAVEPARTPRRRRPPEGHPVHRDVGGRRDGVDHHLHQARHRGLPAEAVRSVLLHARLGACLDKKRMTDELQQWNLHLTERVDEKVAEVERLNMLRRFVTPQLAEALASGGEGILASHRREITALFCDLRGFTAFSETADPRG